MNGLTVRGIDPELEQRLRDVAREHRISLNKAAILLLRRGVGLEEEGDDEPKGAVGDSLDAYFGGWTEAEANAFDAAVAVFEQVDEAIWR